MTRKTVQKPYERITDDNRKGHVHEKPFYTNYHIWVESEVGVELLFTPGGNFAADMRFAQLLVYDENFDAELFRSVPTLELYFSDWNIERSAINTVADVLIGTWDWHSGWYTFNSDGTGSREWSGVCAEFFWSTTDNLVFIHLPDYTASWVISITSNDEMTMAGAAFSRRE